MLRTLIPTVETSSNCQPTNCHHQQQKRTLSHTYYTTYNGSCAYSPFPLSPYMYNNTWVYFFPPSFFWPYRLLANSRFHFYEVAYGSSGSKKREKKSSADLHTTRNLHCWMSFCLCACDLVLYLLPPGRKTAHSYTQFLGSAFVLVVVVVSRIFMYIIYTYMKWWNLRCICACGCIWRPRVVGVNCSSNTIARSVYVRYNTPSSLPPPLLFPPNIWSLFKLA